MQNVVSRAITTFANIGWGFPVSVCLLLGSHTSIQKGVVNTSISNSTSVISSACWTSIGNPDRPRHNPHPHLTPPHCDELQVSTHRKKGSLFGFAFYQAILTSGYTTDTPSFQGSISYPAHHTPVSVEKNEKRVHTTYLLLILYSIEYSC